MSNVINPRPPATAVEVTPTQITRDTAVSERVAEALDHLVEMDPDQRTAEALEFIGRHLHFAEVRDGELSVCPPDDSAEDLIGVATVVLAMQDRSRRIHGKTPVVAWSGRVLDLRLVLVTSGPDVVALAEVLDDLAVTS